MNNTDIASSAVALRDMDRVRINQRTSPAAGVATPARRTYCRHSAYSATLPLATATKAIANPAASGAPRAGKSIAHAPRTGCARMTSRSSGFTKLWPSRGRAYRLCRARHPRSMLQRHCDGAHTAVRWVSRQGASTTEARQVPGEPADTSANHPPPSSRRSSMRPPRRQHEMMRANAVENTVGRAY